MRPCSGIIGERLPIRLYLTVGMLTSGLFTCLFGLGYVYNIHSLGFYVFVQVRLTAQLKMAAMPSLRRHFPRRTIEELRYPETCAAAELVTSCAQPIRSRAQLPIKTELMGKQKLELVELELVKVRKDHMLALTSRGRRNQLVPARFWVLTPAGHLYVKSLSSYGPKKQTFLINKCIFCQMNTVVIDLLLISGGQWFGPNHRLAQFGYLHR